MSEEFLWSQFCNLGEMIGDGLAHQPDGKWISREYKRTAKALGLLPATKRKNHSNQIDEFMNKRVKETVCKLCGGTLVQVRKGSLRAVCQKCGSKFQLGRRR